MKALVSGGSPLFYCYPLVPLAAFQRCLRPLLSAQARARFHGRLLRLPLQYQRPPPTSIQPTALYQNTGRNDTQQRARAESPVFGKVSQLGGPPTLASCGTGAG